VSEEAHFGFLNIGLLCSYCGNIMDGSESDHSEWPFKFIWICRNVACAHFGIRYFMPREQGVKLERIL
jgi:hypothetical protein